MRQKSVLKNDRGAALVSIMIAVAFITILATSILYISLNNYKMKVVNYESKVNFYETEQSVTQMSTNLRNNVMASNSPVNTLKLQAGINANSRYSVAELAKQAFPTYSVTDNGDSAVVTDLNGDVFTFSSSVPSGQPNYEETPEANGITKIALKGIEVKQIESGTKNTNKITTDLVMYIQQNNTPSEMGGIGDFSLMMDSTVACTATEATKLNLFGNGFFLGVDPSSTTSMPGRAANGSQAILLTEECVYNILGDYTLVYGDIVLRDGAALNIINGSLTVYGNIYLYDDSTITCSGELYFPDPSVLDQTGMPYGIKYVKPAEEQMYPSNLESLVQYITPENCAAIVEDMKLNDIERDNDGLVAQILAPQRNVDNTGNAYYFYEVPTYSNSASTSSVSINGINYTTRYFSVGIANADIANSLVFMKGDTVIRQNNENSTIISRNKVSFDQVHELNLTKMGTNAFTYLTLKKSDVDNGKYQEFNYNNNIHRIELGGKKYEVGGFFKPDADGIVKRVMGTGVNNAGGAPTFSSSIGYQNWSKE